MRIPSRAPITARKRSEALTVRGAGRKPFNQVEKALTPGLAALARDGSNGGTKRRSKKGPRNIPEEAVAAKRRLVICASSRPAIEAASSPRH